MTSVVHSELVIVSSNVRLSDTDQLQLEVDNAVEPETALSSNH